MLAGVPCDVLQPALPAAGFAVVGAGVLVGRAWRDRRAGPAVLAVMLFLVAVALVVSNGTVGCAA